VTHALFDVEAIQVELRFASGHTDPVSKEATSAESEPNVAHILEQVVEAVLVEPTIDVSPIALRYSDVQREGTISEGDTGIAPIATIARNEIIVLNLQHNVGPRWRVALVRFIETVVPHYRGISLDFALDVNHGSLVYRAGILGGNVVNARTIRISLAHAAILSRWKRKSPPSACGGRVGRYAIAVSNLPITGIHRYLSHGGFDRSASRQANREREDQPLH